MHDTGNSGWHQTYYSRIPIHPMELPSFSHSPAVFELLPYWFVLLMCSDRLALPALASNIQTWNRSTIIKQDWFPDWSVAGPKRTSSPAGSFPVKLLRKCPAWIPMQGGHKIHY